MAIDYSGTGQYHSASTAVVTAAPLTMSCWCRPDTLTANYLAFGLGRSGTSNNYFTFGMYGGLAGDPVWFESRSTSVASSQSGSSPIAYSTSSWNHVLGVANSNASRYLWLNGVAGNHDTTAKDPVGLNTTDLGVTTINTAVAPLNGVLAECAIWDAALTDAEIASLAKGVSARRIRPQSLKFYAPMVRAVQDIKGALTLTQTGSPTAADHPRIYR